MSIIICARNEEDNLKQFLPIVLQQDYPTFEVIVVNDGSSDDTITVLDELQKTFPILRYTTIDRNPSSIKYPISPKKMAITLGVKAAKYEQLLFIDADCRPSSTHWLALMVRNFLPETEFILGYGGYF
ncbi:MAG: glycosyltransferase, partial [Bacteroidales bacterium]|nr:glycosyltransferase [Bacteroidales bacterium]